GMDIAEVQEICIATKTMPRPDWVRARAYSWWVEFAYLKRKLLQLPIAILRSVGIPYAETFKFLLEGEWPQTVIFAQIRDFIKQKSISVQQGGPEVHPVKTPQGELWVTVEEYLITGMSQTQAWPLFFEEAQRIFAALLKLKGIQLPPGVLEEAMMLAAFLDRSLLTEESFELNLSYNIWQVYLAQLRGEHLDLAPWQGVALRDWKGVPYQTVKLREAGSLEAVLQPV
ncbi:MAG TPA: hypothetical protein V6D23_02875, partial [Candidatus Obscuribacterales bacterium]